MALTLIFSVTLILIRSKRRHHLSVGLLVQVVYSKDIWQRVILMENS